MKKYNRNDLFVLASKKRKKGQCKYSPFAIFEDDTRRHIYCSKGFYDACKSKK